MDAILKVLQMLTFIITIVGFPAGFIVYLREQKKQREEREYGTFDMLDNKYIELQQLCLKYPELDIFDTPYTNRPQLTEAQTKQEEAIMLIRISIFERAFLMYRRCDEQSRPKQWEGWEIEIKEWFARDNFVEVWQAHGIYFDLDFVEYMNSIYLSKQEQQNLPQDDERELQVELSTGT